MRYDRKWLRINLQGKKHTAGKQQAIASWRYLFIFFSASCFSVKGSRLWNTRHSRHLPGAKGEAISVQSGHIGIHKDKVAYASGHDEQVEYFVGTEALVL